MKLDNIKKIILTFKEQWSCFIKRQFQDLRRNKLSALLSKFQALFFMLLAPLGVLLVRILRLFVTIRFGGLISGRIGHLAANTELYLCERDMGMHDRRTIDIFYHTLPVCNHQLKKMWDRKLHVFNFVRWTHKLNQRIPSAKKHEIPLSSDQDLHNLLARTPAHLSFIAEEENLGLKAMRKLGLPEGISFICLFARDPAYLDNKLPSENWRYHNYRDCNIQNYIPAVRELTRRGYFVVRMGAVVKEPLKATDPKIIDYAANGRTDFLDIYLSAKCRFFVSSTGGLNAVPRIFRRPIVYVNFIPLEINHLFSCTPANLFIPKKLWLRSESRFLNFREIVDTGIGSFFSTGQYEQHGIEVIENTPEEITGVVMEMEERLEGKWQSTKEDEELQDRFWSFFKQDHLQGENTLRIGREFLRQNRELLQ